VYEPDIRKIAEQSPDGRSYQALVENVQDYAILMLDANGYVMVFTITSSSQ
jgi:hypothetical protein